jgi:hypothetical protein
MIQLDFNEKLWIKLCKGHLKDKYPFTGRWIDTLKPLFTEIYGWNPDEDKNYQDYLNCIFNKLFDIHLKIVYDMSGTNLQIRNIFNAAFNKSISRMDDLPIERAISELCVLLQLNQVILENGEHRYEL